jgi:sarcosine oxidase gamma subunit
VVSQHRQFDNWQKQCYFATVNPGLRQAVGALPDMSADDKVVARAKKRLARRRGVSEEKIVLKHIERVTWPDASLGYPKKGRMYAQVVAPGYRLVLSDGTADFEYHTDDYRRVVLYRGSKQSERQGGVK